MQSVADDAEVRLARWMADTVGIAGARPGPLLTGGNANVTRLIETDAGRLVLRHPPVNVVSDKAAAGIAREFAVLKALHGRAPVPRPVAWCDDRTILGQPFAITEWVDGVALTADVPSAYPAGVGSVDSLGKAMMEGLAAVHSIAWRDVLPADFGRPEGFVQRQLDRWTSVRETASVRELPLLGEIAQWLRENMPPLDHASIIHCDFHLDNCLVARDRPALRAILDWEMATIGDPLVDVGLCLFFWRRNPEGRIGFPVIQALSNHPDAMSRAQLADHWSSLTGIDTANLLYYEVFSAWRLAAIVEGAYVLFRNGKVDSPYARGLEQDVPALLGEAAALIDGGNG